MKLNDIQKYKIQNSFRDLSQVLREIKKKELSPKQLVFMKQLEEAVQIIEVLESKIS